MAQMAAVGTVATVATAAISRASVAISTESQLSPFSKLKPDMEIEKSSRRDSTNGFELSRQWFGELNPFVDTWNETMSEMMRRVNEEDDVEKKGEMEKLQQELEKGAKECKNGMAVEEIANSTMQKLDEIKKQMSDYKVVEQLNSVTTGVKTMQEFSKENLQSAIGRVRTTYNEFCEKQPGMPSLEELWSESKQRAKLIDSNHKHEMNGGEEDKEEHEEEEMVRKFESNKVSSANVEQPAKSIAEPDPLAEGMVRSGRKEVLVSAAVWLFTFAFILLRRWKKAGL